MRAQDVLSPGDSGYDYPDDDEPADDDEREPDPSCYFDGYGPCVNRGNCMYFGCYHQGMWSYPRVDGEPAF